MLPRSWSAVAGSNRRTRFCRPGGRPLPYGTRLALRVGFEPTSPGLEAGILPLDERSGLAGILGFEPSASGLTDRPDHPGRLMPRDCWSGKPDSNRSSSRWKREILSHWTMPANWCRPEGSNPDVSGFSGAPGPPRPERHFAIGCGGPALRSLGEGGWSQRMDSNHRLERYERPDLPLIYAGVGTDSENRTHVSAMAPPRTRPCAMPAYGGA